MKIGVVGCGAVGSYYGALLCRAGHQVHFLLRSDYAAVQTNGVRIRSCQGDFAVHPVAARQPEEIGVCDLVLIALKTTANDQFPALLPPLIGPRTVVVTLQNGLGNIEALSRLAPVAQILGGLCFVCLNRVAPGVIEHAAHGLVVVGEAAQPANERLEPLAATFRAAGFPCKTTPDLVQAQWEKLVWNIPFNGLGVAGVAGYEAVATGTLPAVLRRGPVLPTDALLRDERWRLLVSELMAEIIAAARSQRKVIPDSWAEEQIRRTLEMSAYKASTLLDFEAGRPLELESLFVEPLRRARSAGVATPRLENLVRVLTSLERAPSAGSLSV